MVKNRGLGSKIIVGFAVPIAILIALSGYVYVQATSVGQVAELTHAESAVYAKLAQEMKLDVVQVQQWLTDISATGAAEGLDDGFEEAEASAGAFLEGLKQFREMYQRENDDAGLRQLADLEQKFAAYHGMGKRMATAYIDEGREAGNKSMGEFDAYATAMTEAIEPFVKQQLDELDQSMSGIVARSTRLRMGALLAGLAALVFSGLTAWLVTWSITRSVIKPINRIISSLTEGADQVNDAAGQVSSAAQGLAEGASEQASSLEETSAALEQMAAMTRANTENAKRASELSDQARSAAQNGDQAMTKLNVAMTAINESSGQISKIIKVIEEIAFQTNLLALNAAVEAARAGEHGKGFAVVADEVRNLAQRAAQAARETTSLIEQSVANARGGAQVAGQVGQALGTIVNDVTRVADLINGISKASDEQSQGVDQINTAVTQLDKVTQQNASGAEESASAAEQLAAQAANVKGIVDELSALVSGSRSGQGRAGNKAPRATFTKRAGASSPRVATQRQPGATKLGKARAQPKEAAVATAPSGHNGAGFDLEGLKEF